MEGDNQALHKDVDAEPTLGRGVREMESFS